jgi:hypothetical protein
MGSFTSKLLNMPGTQRSRYRGRSGCERVSGRME